MHVTQLRTRDCAHAALLHAVGIGKNRNSPFLHVRIRGRRRAGQIVRYHRASGWTLLVVEAAVADVVHVVLHVAPLDVVDSLLAVDDHRVAYGHGEEEVEAGLVCGRLVVDGLE